MPAEPASVDHGRLEFLDAVRGIAAVLVVLGHVFEIDHGNRGFLYSVLNPGAMGVSAFFLVSGFIIPFSLERQNDLRKFWISRVLRVYPLYIFTLSIVTAWCYLSPALATPMAGYEEGLPKTFLVNLTMLQHLLHKPTAVGAYWTLSYELVFYVACTVFFALKVLKRADWLVWLCALVGLLGVRTALKGGDSLSYNGLIATMFAVGILTYRLTFQQLSRKTALPALVALVLAWGTAIALVAPRLERHSVDDPTRLCQLFSFGMGYALFFGLYALRRREFPRVLTWLGEISYSVYLVHGMLFALGLPGGPLVKGSLIVLLTAVISPLTYRFVEKPAVAYGKTLIRRLGVTDAKRVAAGSVPARGLSFATLVTIETPRAGTEPAATRFAFLAPKRTRSNVASTIASIPNLSVRPRIASAIRLRTSSSASSSIAAANAAGSRIGTSRPFSPSVTISPTPPTRVETMGNPHIAASRSTYGNPS